MPGLASPEEHTPEQKAIFEKVNGRFNGSEKLHKSFEPRWNTYYGLSRNYRRLQRQHAQANTPNDRDTVMQEFRRVFGEELFIPYIFTVIETNLPRIMASDPQISVKPNNPEDVTREACEPVKRLFERDQKKMAYELRLQETVRSGLRYGLGVQKMYWQSKFRKGMKVVPMSSGDGYKLETDKQILVYQGPMAESVDIFDFFWDPVAYDLASAGYVIHRTWRSMEYIEERVKEGQERRAKDENGGWVELDLEIVKGMGTSTGRGEVWAERMLAAGMSNFDTEGNKLHEVWEYHDRDFVYTILDRKLVVQASPNPFLHGDLPFQIYRPTMFEHEFCGIGEAEPIAHLQYELNTMRGQRRDAATLAMNRGYFYSRGMLNPAKVVTGAGVFVPVTGDPKDVIFPMPFQDLPASGVSEEQALKGDIEMTTGVSESSTGGGGEETATGTQLVQAAANQRIKQKAKNLHPDLLRPATAQQRELYRQHLTEEDQTQTIRVEDNTTPDGYVFIKCGPREINADIDVEPVDGSTEAENEAQKRNDAVQFMAAMAPFIEDVDVAAVLKYFLIQFGVDQPEELLKPPGPPADQVVESIGKTMQEAGIPEDFIHQVLQAALQRLQETPEQPQPESGSSPNGAAPKPEPVGASNG